MSTINWWQNVEMDLGYIKNVKNFYKCFGNCVLKDLCLSDRLRESGLEKLFCDIVKFCFAGEVCYAPV